MDYELQTAQLPSAELGSDRCLQMGYFNHGDIFVATWSGDLAHQPRAEDGISTRFKLAHGADSLLLASCVGYLRRIQTPEAKVRTTIIDAAQEVIYDNELGDMSYHRSGLEPLTQDIAEAEDFPHWDLPESGLSCLMPPRATRPGVPERVGGTAIYTRACPEGQDRLVYANHRPNSNESDTTIYTTADFCLEDVPVIAKMVCNMSLGEYRKDIRKFVGVHFLGEEQY